MKQSLLRLAITAAAIGLLSSNLGLAQVVPPAPRAKSVQIIEGPSIERGDDFLTIIRWTSNNPGGAPEHMAVVRYGTDPRNLNQIAKSPIRLNQNHPTTVFRVRLQGLKAGTTYYYRVDSAEAGSGRSDGVNSPLRQFTPKKLVMGTVH